jgi:hypothetical protein
MQRGYWRLFWKIGRGGMALRSPRLRGRASPVRLNVEALEERTLLSGSGSGSLFDIAQPFTLNASSATTLTGTIATADQIALFRFTAPVTASLQIEMDAAIESLINPLLGAYDGSQTLLASNDDIGSTLATPLGNTNSLLTMNVTAGQTYFLQAAGSQHSAGSYVITVTPYADDAPNTFAGAPTITLASNGSGSQAASIEVPGDADFFRFVAPASGLLTVHQDAAPGSTLNPFLSAYDVAQTLITTSGNGKGAQTSVVHFPVTAGQTYFLKAATFVPISSGAYTLSFDTTPQPSTSFTSPVALPLDSTDAGSAIGEVASGGAATIYAFVAHQSGALTIRQFGDPNAAGPLTTSLSVYDATQTLLAMNNHFDGTTNSEVVIQVAVGKSYFIKAAAMGNGTGVYFLSLAHDDPADSLAQAQPLSLAADGTATQTGAVLAFGDSDFFSFVAPHNGTMIVQEEAAPGSTLDSQLTAYDASFHPITFNDDSNGSLDSQVQFVIFPGQTYYLKAAAAPFSTGKYLLELEIDSDEDTTFANAIPIPLDVFQSGGVVDSIKTPADPYVFAFTATSSSFLIIRGTGDPGAVNPVIPQFFIFDSSLQQVAVGDPFNPVRLNAEVGATFFVSVHPSPSGPPSGVFFITVSTVTQDDVPDTFSGAHFIPLAPDGSGSQTGAIDFAFDRDMFSFIAPKTGILTIEQDAFGTSNLDSFLRIYDSAGGPIAGDDNISFPAFSLNSRVQVVVQQGQRYFVEAAGAGSSTGTYLLTFGLSEPIGFLPGPTQTATTDAASLLTASSGQVQISDLGSLLQNVAHTETVLVSSSFVTLLPAGGSVSSLIYSSARVEQIYTLQSENDEKGTSNYDTVLVSQRGSDPGAAPADRMEDTPSLVDTGLPILLPATEDVRGTSAVGVAQNNSPALLIPLPRTTGAFVPAFLVSDGDPRTANSSRTGAAGPGGGVEVDDVLLQEPAGAAKPRDDRGVNAPAPSEPIHREPVPPTLEGVGQSSTGALLDASQRQATGDEWASALLLAILTLGRPVPKTWNEPTDERPPTPLE